MQGGVQECAVRCREPITSAFRHGPEPMDARVAIHGQRTDAGRHLQLARATGRQREIGVRLAFGTVKGYTEDGQPVPPFTQVGGLYKRAADQGNKGPFELPPRAVPPYVLHVGDLHERRNLPMLVELARLSPHPESVPINALVRVAGTPLESLPPIVAARRMPVRRLWRSAWTERLWTSSGSRPFSIAGFR